MAASKITKADWPDIGKLYASGKTLAAIGEIYGITRERVRQIVGVMGVIRPPRVKYVYARETREEYFQRQRDEQQERVVANSSFARVILSGRQEAGSIVAKAIQSGELLHPTNFPCADCGGKATEYEHRDYNFPLMVDPVCRGCNARRGQAKPKDGFFQKMISLGHEPFAYRLHMKRLAAIYGIEIAQIDLLPKRLNVEHWIEHWPLSIPEPINKHHRTKVRRAADREDRRNSEADK